MAIRTIQQRYHYMRQVYRSRVIWLINLQSKVLLTLVATGRHDDLLAMSFIGLTNTFAEVIVCAADSLKHFYVSF